MGGMASTQLRGLRFEGLIFLLQKQLRISYGPPSWIIVSTLWVVFGAILKGMASESSVSKVIEATDHEGVEPNEEEEAEPPKGKP